MAMKVQTAEVIELPSWILLLQQGNQFLGLFLGVNRPMEERAASFVATAITTASCTFCLSYIPWHVERFGEQSNWKVVSLRSVVQYGLSNGNRAQRYTAALFPSPFCYQDTSPFPLR